MVSILSLQPVSTFSLPSDPILLPHPPSIHISVLSLTYLLASPPPPFILHACREWGHDLMPFISLDSSKTSKRLSMKKKGHRNNGFQEMFPIKALLRL